jgi:hypothetical protein
MSDHEPTDAIAKLVWMQMRACMVSVDCNDHRSSYRTVEEEFEILKLLDEDYHEDFASKDVRATCLKTGQLVTVRCYTSTPIGQYVVRHYDAEQAIDEMFQIVKGYLQSRPFKERA